jgi:hypothetical protein
MAYFPIWHMANITLIVALHHSFNTTEVKHLRMKLL